MGTNMRTQTYQSFVVVNKQGLQMSQYLTHLAEDNIFISSFSEAWL